MNCAIYILVTLMPIISGQMLAYDFTPVPTFLDGTGWVVLCDVEGDAQSRTQSMSVFIENGCAYVNVVARNGGDKVHLSLDGSGDVNGNMVTGSGESALEGGNVFTLSLSVANGTRLTKMVATMAVSGRMVRKWTYKPLD